MTRWNMAFVIAAAILMALSSPSALAYSSPSMRTQNDMRIIRIAIDLFHADHAAFPSIDRYMADLEPYLAKLIRTNATGLPLDRWGHPLVLRVPGTRQEIDIYSVGADGLDDGGERDDISSWAGINEGYYEKRSWPQGRRILRVGPFLCLSCLLLLAVLPWRIVLSITVLAISLTAAAGFSMLYHPAVMHSYNQSITLKIGCALLVAFVCFVLVLRDASKNLMTRHRSTTNQGVQ